MLACQSLSPLLVRVWSSVFPRTKQSCLELAFGASAHLHGAIRDVWLQRELGASLSSGFLQWFRSPTARHVSEGPKKADPQPWCHEASFSSTKKEHWLHRRVEHRSEESRSQEKVRGHCWCRVILQQRWAGLWGLEKLRRLKGNQHKENNGLFRCICSFCLCHEWILLRTLA